MRFTYSVFVFSFWVSIFGIGFLATCCWVLYVVLSNGNFAQDRQDCSVVRGVNYLELLVEVLESVGALHKLLDVCF